MNGNKFIIKFSEILCSNAGAVLSTITSQNISFTPSESEKFDLGKIEKALELPLILLSITFSGDQNFLVQILVSTKDIAKLSDFMMLGDGTAEYEPDEHNDAAQEMFNQIIGSVTSELASLDLKATGNVTQIEVTDMSIQKQIFEDSETVRLNINIADSDSTMFLVFDSDAISSINNLLAKGQDTPTQAGESDKQSTAAVDKEEESEEEPMTVSKASFSEFDSKSSSPKTNINLDILMDVVLPISVELGRKDMKIKEILELGQGSIVELDKLAGELVDLMVNGRKFAVGEVMVADENYAVRIISLVSREERIRSLGKK